MDFGLTLPTHGVMSRDHERDAILRNVPAADMRPVELAVRAEEIGFHSVWFSDHIVTETVTTVDHPANTSGKRVYPERPILLDVATTMGAIASRTTTLRFSPSVYIAPYRHPLITAHEWATLDVLSNGRAMMAVGVGWETGEFAAMGAEYEARGAVTAECIQVYKLAWTEPVINFKGRFFEISDVSMDPKPVQDPHPPIWYGGMSKIAAKRAARDCDGFYPMFLDAVTTPETLAPLSDEIRREAERVERDLSAFQLGGFCQVRVAADAEKDPRFNGERPLLTGTAEQILEDLQQFANHGYSHVTVHLDCPDGTMDEWVEQMERFAAEVLPEARNIQHRHQF